MTTDVTRPHPDPTIEGWLQDIGLKVQRAARYGAEDWIIERVAQAIRTGEALGPHAIDHVAVTDARSGHQPEKPGTDAAHAADGGAHVRLLRRQRQRRQAEDPLMLIAALCIAFWLGVVLTVIVFDLSRRLAAAEDADSRHARRLGDQANDIERLTRRVTELEAALRDPAQRAEIGRNVAPALAAINGGRP